jgi:hypothetical protein
VNNRDLKTFDVKLETSLELIDRIPPSVVRVTESGISTSGRCFSPAKAGFDAFLIGESLMRQPDPGVALAETFDRNGCAAMSLWIKICANTSLATRNWLSAKPAPMRWASSLRPARAA